MTWQFEYPLAFLIVLLYILCKLLCKKKLKEVYFSNMEVLESIVKKKKDLHSILEFLMVLFLAFSLASPIKTKTISEESAEGYEIVLSIDASESMRSKNKFENTKEIIRMFVEKRKFDRLGLTLFAQDVYIAVPFTYDKKPLLDILKYIEIGVAGNIGTALNEALYVSSNLFKEIRNKNKILILLTDGINTKESVPLQIAIQNAKKYNIKVYTIAIGEEGDYNKEALSLIAKQTNGKFFVSSEAKGLASIYDSIDELEKSKIEISKRIEIQYFYKYSLIFSLICLMILIFINRIKK